MTALYIIAFLIACIGIVLALGITPERVGEDMKRFFDKQQTMQDMAKEAQGKKKPNKLMVEMIRIRKVLEETNKENQFSIALALSLVLMVFGCILGIVIDNIFLAPILAVAFALIPFMYLKGTINKLMELAEETTGDPERYEAELVKVYGKIGELRKQLDLAKAQTSTNEALNVEVERIMKAIAETDISAFAEYDDVIVRRLVECIRVMPNRRIVVVLKGGRQDEEPI